MKRIFGSPRRSTGDQSTSAWPQGAHVADTSRLLNVWKRIEVRGRFTLGVFAMAMLMSLATGAAHAQLEGGVVSAGSATISSQDGRTTINQSTQKTAINWQRFDIGANDTVEFRQPDRKSIALNRVLGSDPSSILGTLSANGQVFLLNPNGVLFGRGAQVNVGGLVASTLSISNDDFMAGRYNFSNPGPGSVINQGSITAAGGYVAMLGAHVSNEGTIAARLGTVVLAAGSAMTLDLAGDGLLNVTVDRAVADALVENAGNITADGGYVLMTTQAAGSMLQGAVNNTGIVQAQTIENRSGTIMLMGNMENGTVNVGGTLDASAPNGGDGGFIETSAAHVKIADNVKVTTAASRGITGMWLIDPDDFIIGVDPDDDITGAELSAQLSTTDITIETEDGGDIHVNDPVAWVGATTLTLIADNDVRVDEAITAHDGGSVTLIAANDVRINEAITATDGNVVVCCGRDITVTSSGTITTTRGSIFLGAGRNINMNGTMTATDGNIAMCAGGDISIGGAITVTHGTTTDGESLGLPKGLTLIAGLDATGPGTGGTVSISSAITVTDDPVSGGTEFTIYSNPSSYQAGADLSGAELEGVAPTQVMWAYPEVADKTFDGDTTATFTGELRGDLSGFNVSLDGSATGDFSDPNVGTDKTVTFSSGFTLVGADAGNFAFTDAGGGFNNFPENCCGSFARVTSGNIVEGSTTTPPPTSPTDTTPTPTPVAVSSPTPTSVGVIPGGQVLPVVVGPVAPPDVGLPTTFAQPFAPVVAVTGLNLAVADSGIRMPPAVQFVQDDVVPAVEWPEAPAPQYVPLDRPPQPDRN